MSVYVMRHAKAAEGAVDGLRPLTERGRSDTEAMGRRLQEAGIAPDRIVHSGLVRARETAELVSAVLGGPAAEQRVGLTSGDEPKPLVEWLRRDVDRSILLVSHQPLVSALVAVMTTGSERTAVADLVTGQIVALEYTGGDRWTIRWSAAPKTP